MYCTHGGADSPRAVLATTFAIAVISDCEAGFCGLPDGPLKINKQKSFFQIVLNSRADFCYKSGVMDSTSWFNKEGLGCLIHR